MVLLTAIIRYKPKLHQIFHRVTIRFANIFYYMAGLGQELQRHYRFRGDYLMHALPSPVPKNTPASLVEKSNFTPYIALTRLANYRRIGQLLGSLRMVRVSRLV